MIVNYQPIENNDIGNIETIYEEYESNQVHKSICKCFRPIKGLDVDTVTCFFYNKDGVEIGKCDLPNGLMYGMYYSQGRGIPIFDNDKIAIIGWPKSLKCYSIKSNSVIWENSMSSIYETYFFKDKLYCLWAGWAKDIVYFVSSKTGTVIKEVIKYNPKKNENERPKIFRLDERYLIIYILGYIYLYDMENDKLLLSNMKFEIIGDSFWLVAIQKKSLEERLLRFREFKVGGEITFHEYVINKKQVISSAKTSNFPAKILSNNEALDKEYNCLFGS